MNIKLHEPTFGEEEIEAAVEVLRSTRVTSGRRVKAFEAAFGDHALMVNSGSSANLLAIATLCNPLLENPAKPGDEVIVPALCWSTTVWPIVQHGLVPVLVDIDPQTLTLDYGQAVEAMTERTRAIMPVHVYGYPARLDYPGAVKVIEDACEALGMGREGAQGDIRTFSFYFSHHITTLEGGMCVFTDPQWAEVARMVRAHGWIRDLERPWAYANAAPSIDPKFLFVTAGYNLRASEVAAAMGLVQFEKLGLFVELRRAAAQRYLDICEPYADVLRCQGGPRLADSSWFGFPLIVERDSPFSSRELRIYLESKHIETRSLICGNMARQPGLGMWPYRVHGELRHADDVMARGFSIGCHQAVGDDDCDYFGAMLASFMRRYE